MPNRSVTYKASGFRGLNNKSDPRTMGPQWLRDAENVDVDNDHHLVRRPGFAKVADGVFRNAFATKAEDALYVASPTTLYWAGDGYELVPIYTGLDPSAPVRFLEINDQVYIKNGGVSLVARGAHVRAWGLPVPPAPSVTVAPGTAPAGAYEFAVSHIAPDGRESGLSPRVQAVAAEPCQWAVQVPQLEGHRTAAYVTGMGDTVLYRAALTTETHLNLTPMGDSLGVAATTEYRQGPPPGAVLGFYGGRVLVGDYFPQTGASMLWQSDPLGFEYFQLDEAFLPVAGEVRAVSASHLGLVIGTDREVLLWSEREELRSLFGYGVPPGTPFMQDDSEVFYGWTDRGLITIDADGPRNLVERAYSPEKAVAASMALVQMGGYSRFMALSQTTGLPYNAWRKG